MQKPTGHHALFSFLHVPVAMTSCSLIFPQVIVALKSAEGVQQLRQLALQLHRMSAALRASLEQHVQASHRFNRLSSYLWLLVLLFLLC